MVIKTEVYVRTPQQGSMESLLQKKPPVLLSFYTSGKEDSGLVRKGAREKLLKNDSEEDLGEEKEDGGKVGNRRQKRGKEACRECLAGQEIL